MSQKLEYAKNLYIQGIKEGDLSAIDRYTGDRYTQHSTGVADGTEGFKAFFSDFLNRTKDRDIKIVRAIEDGRYIFVHVFQDIDKGTAKWITTDLFDTDKDGKIVEHWDVIGAYVEKDKTASGRDVIFGDFELKDLDKTEQNKALVRSFLVDILQNKNYQAVDKYISTEKYIDHNPLLPDGIDAIKSFLATGDVYYDFVFKVIGQGDHVVSFSQVVSGGQETAVFDIFRLENGKIVEHWDNSEPIPPRSEWANSGKF